MPSALTVERRAASGTVNLSSTLSAPLSSCRTSPSCSGVRPAFCFLGRALLRATTFAPFDCRRRSSVRGWTSATPNGVVLRLELSEGLQPTRLARRAVGRRPEPPGRRRCPACRGGRGVEPADRRSRRAPRQVGTLGLVDPLGQRLDGSAIQESPMQSTSPRSVACRASRSPSRSASSGVSGARRPPFPWPDQTTVGSRSHTTLSWVGRSDPASWHARQGPLGGGRRRAPMEGGCSASNGAARRDATDDLKRLTTRGRRVDGPDLLLARTWVTHPMRSWTHRSMHIISVQCAGSSAASPPRAPATADRRSRRGRAAHDRHRAGRIRQDDLVRRMGRPGGSTGGMAEPHRGRGWAGGLLGGHGRLPRKPLRHRPGGGARSGASPVCRLGDVVLWLLNELHDAPPTPGAIVLDDFQEVEDDIVDASLNLFLRHLPDHLRVLHRIPSRARPADRAAAGGRCARRGAVQ